MSDSDYNQHHCPKCGARLGHVEADFTKNVMIYRPCGCEAPLLVEGQGHRIRAAGYGGIVSDSDRLHDKYTVIRNDGREKPNARYFVLDYINDPHARAALSAYAESVHRENPDLASDLRGQLIELGREMTHREGGTMTNPEHAGLSQKVLDMIGKDVTYEREGRRPRSGVVKAVRRVGWMQTEEGRFPAFEMLVGGHWTSAFADPGDEPGRDEP